MQKELYQDLKQHDMHGIRMDTKYTERLKFLNPTDEIRHGLWRSESLISDNWL
jgi:hypothetical protein